VNIPFILLAGLLLQAPASVDGVVVKLGSGEPLAAANVQLHPEKGSGPQELHLYNATTGTDGKFNFNNVAPGVYRLIATRSGGYVPGEYGQRLPTREGIPITISAGQKVSGVQLALAPTGSISGHVFDRDGEPMGNVLVEAMRPIYRDGRRTLTIVQSVLSDDRGEYRLFWLPPGRYYVTANPDAAELPADMAVPDGAKFVVVHITEPARFSTYQQASQPTIRKRVLKTGEVVEETYMPVFYPGVTDAAGALAINVAAGGNTGGIDVSIGAGVVQTWHIRGRVISAADGRPAVITGISVLPRISEPLLSVPAGRTDSTGAFDIAGVRPGSYFVFASQPPAERRSGGSGVVSVEVGNADIQNLTIVTTPGFTLAGKFIIEGRFDNANDPQASGPRIARLTRDPEILGMPAGGPSFSPPPRPDGSFNLEGISPGHYRVNVYVPPGGYVKSMRMGNVDVLDSGLQLDGTPENPLEIVVGVNAGRIEGSVTNAAGESLPNRTVTLIPDARLRQRMDLYKNVVTNSAGRFRLEDIPPGDYELYAWEDIEPGAWQDSEYLQTYRGRGKLVHISEGSRESLQLTVIP